MVWMIEPPTASAVATTICPTSDPDSAVVISRLQRTLACHIARLLAGSIALAGPVRAPAGLGRHRRLRAGPGR
jgi:hypothetical protein